MQSVAITATYAAWFGLLFVALSVWVVAGRARTRVHHGDGGVEALNRRIRAHGNFAEYVPMALLLVGLAETGGTRPAIIHALLAALLIARLVHPVGMLAPVASVRQYATRAPAMVVTWAVIAIAALLILAR